MADIIAKISPRKKLVRLHEPRRKAALMGYVRQIVARHSKVDESTVKIDGSLNQYMLSTSNPMRSLEVRITKEANVARVALLNAKQPAKAPAATKEKAPEKVAVPAKKAEQKKEPRQEKKAEQKPEKQAGSEPAAEAKQSKPAPKPKDQPAK